MKKIFYTIDRVIPVNSVVLTRDKTLPKDGYSFFVTDEGDVIGKFYNERAKNYLEEEIAKERKSGKIRKVYLKDYPCFPFRAAIEGFYGTPFTQAQRKDLLSFLKKIRMNAYIYAPKDDLYHRDAWRNDYPGQTLSLLKELREEADKNFIDFYFAVSPGKDFCYADDKDYLILLQKLKAVSACGIDKFALLMDDIQPVLSEEEAKIYHSPAHAQAALANRLAKDLPKSAPLLFCPTDVLSYRLHAEFRYAVQRGAAKISAAGNGSILDGIQYRGGSDNGRGRRNRKKMFREGTDFMGQLSRERFFSEKAYLFRRALQSRQVFI